jgi:acyl-coenzyme A thioesterase PaaI-like protein
MKLRDYTSAWNLWPPFLGLGISIRNASEDFRKLTIVLKKRPWNVNYVGTQYGGGIFAMTDGVHMLMLLRNLPKTYQVWDKSAQIDYLKPGKTDLMAEFELTDQQIKEIESDLSGKGSIDWKVGVDIQDKSGTIIARVTRTVTIKHKSPTK